MKHKKFINAFLSLFLTISIFTISLPQIGFAQSSAKTAKVTDIEKRLSLIEAKLEKRRMELGIPGVSLAIVKDGETIYSKGLGYKDFENKVPITADTQLAIGSATKAFTGLSTLLLQDQGKLSLDDSPKKYLPYFKMNNPETDEKITIRDLLSHSSGLNRTDLAMITGKLNRVELIKVAGIAKPITGLRKKFLYQNIMFAAAGELVAEIENQSYEEFVPQKIFAPLGMDNSTMTVKQMQKSKDYSFGYNYNFDTKETKRVPTRDITHIAPAGSINSSANDMSKWLKFILSGGKAGKKQFVSKTSFEEWIKPQMKITPDGKVSYGLGWFIQDWKGKKVVQHGGNIDGFNSMVAMMPEENLGFVMLTNVTGSSLGGELMEIVWSGMLEDATDIKLTEQDKKEIGIYEFPQAGLDIEVKIKDGKLVAVVPGQPTYVLENVESRRYKLSNAPAGFFITFKDSEALLEQPQGNFTLPRKGTAKGETNNTKTDVSAKEKPKTNFDISVDELMSKTVTALGGEANMRKINSRMMEFKIDAVHQGVKGYGTIYQMAPNKSASNTTITALGKKIGSIKEFFDGTKGGEEYSFSPDEEYTGKRLEDVKVNNDLYTFLDWKDKYKSVEIVKMDKVDDEEVYIAKFDPKNASSFAMYISSKTFLPLKKRHVIVSSTSSQVIPIVEIYSDRREVDGLMIAFKVVSVNPSMGDIITYVTKIKHNVKIPESKFQK